MSDYHDTMFRRAERVRLKISDAYSLARHFHQPHAAIVDKLKEIRASKDYTKLSPYYRGAAEERIRSEGERMYDFLEWRVCLDGKLIPSKEVPDGRWSDVVPDAGRHVYKDDPRAIY